MIILCSDIECAYKLQAVVAIPSLRKVALYDQRHKSLACPLISSNTCNVYVTWLMTTMEKIKLLIVCMDDTMCAIHACITVQFVSLEPLSCMQCEVGAMNACSSSYMNQAVNMANITV